MENMNLLTAIHYMKMRTASSKSFSLTYYTYNRETGEAGGVRYHKSVKLRPQATADQVENSRFKIFFVDLETGEAKTCWAPLIVFIDNHKIKL